MKLHLNEVEKNIKSEIGQVEKLTDDPKNQEKQFAELSKEIKKVAEYVPKVETLEKDLELLDQSTDFKDPELEGLEKSMN